MNKKSISLLITTSLIVGTFSYQVSYADTLSDAQRNESNIVETTPSSTTRERKVTNDESSSKDTIDKSNEDKPHEDLKTQKEEGKVLDNSYITFKNVWGGNSLKILFDQSTMKINALAQSGNFSRSDDNFTFKLINKENGQVILNESADSKNVTKFTPKLNGKSFSYGDIIALNINSSSGLKNPSLYSGGKSSWTNCVGKTQYFEITKDGIVNYIPDITVEPIVVEYGSKVTSLNIKGTANKNSKLLVSVNNQVFTGTSNSKGEFNIPVTDNDGFSSKTPITISYENKIPVNLKIMVDEGENLDNPYIRFKNVWGGNSLKILFNERTMKIKAIAESGNFGRSNDNFTFMLINKETGQPLLKESADSKNVIEFTPKLTGQSFKYGDIIALNINSSSGLKNPSLYSSGKTEWTNCVGKTQYFEITKEGIVNYIPNIAVDPLKILGDGIVRKTTILGTTKAGNEVSVSVNGQSFSGTANGEGKYSIDISDENGFTSTTPIEVNVGEFSTKVYPQLLEKNNMSQETITGYKYVLNADLSILTKPFQKEILYARTLLSPEGQKAWDLAYRTLLNYDNSEDKYPRDSKGNTKVYIDYAANGIDITSSDAQKIQNYLVRNCPRMFLLKDWGANTTSKDGKIVGQTFFVGNGVANGDDYHKQLLQTEKSVTKILNKIQPNMSLYQILKTVQVNYENMVTYRNAGACGDIRGTFINNYAVCGGYAKGYEYLLQRLGMEIIWVNGYAAGPHAWNFTNIYGHWYLSDTTWGKENWYLNGWDSRFTANHHVYDTYSVMPKLTKDSVSWDIGNPNQTIANLTGAVNYKNNNDGTITITYKDSQNRNTSVQVNPSTNEWKSVDMKNDGHGLWSVTIPYNTSVDSETKANSINFYFTVNGKYYTPGNIKANNLKTEILPNGMNNVVVTLE